jgi:hypothetical protein
MYTDGYIFACIYICIYIYVYIYVFIHIYNVRAAWGRNTNPKRAEALACGTAASWRVRAAGGRKKKRGSKSSGNEVLWVLTRGSQRLRTVRLPEGLVLPHVVAARKQRNIQTYKHTNIQTYIRNGAAVSRTAWPQRRALRWRVRRTDGRRGRALRIPCLVGCHAKWDAPLSGIPR